MRSTSAEASAVYASAAEPVDGKWWLDAARNVAAVATQEASGSEDRRRISDRIIGTIKAAGLHRLLQPARYGGSDRQITDLIDAVEIVARAYGSAGWVLAVLTGHTLDIRDFPHEAQDEIWGIQPDAIACSSYAPVGRAVRVKGGYRLSGDYPFASGCDHAQWAVVGVMRPDGDDTQPTGNPTLRMLVPLDQVTIIDDWHTLGLRGTGSRTLRIDEVFIPDHRRIVPRSIEGTADPLTLGMTMVSIAHSAVDQFVEGLKGKPGTRGRVPPAESEITQMMVGQSYAECEAAATLIKHGAARAMAFSKADYPLHLRAEVRGMSGLVARLATQAVDRLQIAGGGHAIYDRSPVQSRFRDVHAAAQHVSFNPEAAFRQSGVMRMAPHLYKPMM